MIWNDGYRAPTPTPVAQAIADDADYYPTCPICGDPCDYCQGHPTLYCGCCADLTWREDEHVYGRASDD